MGCSAAVGAAHAGGSVVGSVGRRVGGLFHAGGVTHVVRVLRDFRDFRVVHVPGGHPMNEIALLIAATLASGTPLAIAGLGLLINEKVGVLNLGAEGMMLVAAGAGFAAAFHTGSITLAMLAHAVLSVLRARGEKNSKRASAAQRTRTAPPTHRTAMARVARH